jgi:hypothetical protein
MTDLSSFGPRPQAPLQKDAVVAYLLEQTRRGYQVYQAPGENGRYDLLLDDVHRINFAPPNNGRTQVQGYALNNLVRYYDVTSLHEFTRAVDAIAISLIGARWQQSPVTGRLKEETPAANLATISGLIGAASVSAIFDPYLENRSLASLIDILSFGNGSVANGVRVLSTAKITGGQVPRLTKTGFDAWLAQLKITGELRLMGPLEHRRFILLTSGQSLLLGHSLNALHKNEAVRLEAADDDRAFFDQIWVQAALVA